MHARLCAVLVLVIAASPAMALFEEQAGENDWHSEYLGRAIDIQPTGKDRLVVSTASNVLATQSATSGTIIWRQILHQTDQLQSLAILSKPAAVVSLSNSSSLLRAWRSSDGALLWEKRIQSSTRTTNVLLSVVPEATLGAGEGIAVVAGGDVQVLWLGVHFSSCTDSYYLYMQQHCSHGICYLTSIHPQCAEAVAQLSPKAVRSSCNLICCCCCCRSTQV